jgi:hypothetical protein
VTKSIFIKVKFLKSKCDLFRKKRIKLSEKACFLFWQQVSKRLQKGRIL